MEFDVGLIVVGQSVGFRVSGLDNVLVNAVVIDWLSIIVSIYHWFTVVSVVRRRECTFWVGGELCKNFFKQTMLSFSLFFQHRQPSIKHVAIDAMHTFYKRNHAPKRQRQSKNSNQRKPPKTNKYHCCVQRQIFRLKSMENICNNGMRK